MSVGGGELFGDEYVVMDDGGHRAGRYARGSTEESCRGWTTIFEPDEESSIVSGEGRKGR